MLEKFKFFSKFIYWDLLPSTNTFLLENSSYYPEGTVVVAGRQTAGYGRRRRVWESDLGGLWFSVFRKKEVSILSNAEMVAVLYEIPLGILLYLREWGIEATLKWPNDIMVEGRKLAGILPETQIAGKTLEALIIGCGLNLANDIPERLKTKATTLKRYLSRNKLEKFKTDFFPFLDHIIFLSSERKLAIMEELYPFWQGRGERYKVIDASGKEYYGIIEDITSDGKLILKLASGEQKIFSQAEIFSLN